MSQSHSQLVLPFSLPRRRSSSRALLAGAFSLLLTGSVAHEAAAIPLDFSCITGNSATDCGIATSQLSVTLDALGTDQVRLTISNDGPAASVYTRVLFDGSVLDAVDAVGNAPPGVEFASVSPGVLPGGNGNPIQFTADLEVSADNPMPQNGVGPGETLTIDLGIVAGSDFADVLAALADGSLRIGMHVQSFASGGSESVLNLPVPEPGTLLLLGAGLAGLVQFGRKER